MCRVDCKSTGAAFEEKKLLIGRIRARAAIVLFVATHTHTHDTVWANCERKTSDFGSWLSSFFLFLVAMRLFIKSVSQKSIELVCSVESSQVNNTLILILTLNILFFMQLQLLITLLTTFLTSFGKCEHDEEGGRSWASKIDARLAVIERKNKKEKKIVLCVTLWLLDIILTRDYKI